MTMRTILKKFPFLTPVIAFLSLIAFSGCTPSEMTGVGAAMAGGGALVGALTDDPTTRKIATGIAIAGAVIAIYGIYKANDSQVNYAKSRGKSKAIPQYKSSGQSRYVAVSVPKNSSAEAKIKKPSNAKNPKTVMVWDNKNERLASDKAYVVDYKNGESANLGGKKTLFTGL